MKVGTADFWTKGTKEQLEELHAVGSGHLP